MYDKRTWNKLLAALHYPRSALVQCFEAFIVRTAEHLGINFCQLLSTQNVDWFQAWRCSSFERPAKSTSIDIQLITIAAIALVYWRSKRVCSSGCVIWTLLEQIFGSFSPLRKCIGTMLGGVHNLNILPGASPLMFIWFTIADISLVYWISKQLCTTNALDTYFY